MKFSWRWASVIGVLMIGIVGSVAVAAPEDGGGGGKSERRGVFFRGPGENLSDLAKELGVSTSQLRDAFEAARDEVGPPERPRRDERPSRSELEEHCTKLTDALASELNKGGDEVRAAIKKVARANIEEAVDDNRISRARANRILERIDSAECLLPLVLHHHGCGGPPPRFERGPGDRLERGSGDRFRGGAVLPAPPPEALDVEGIPAA
jgi:hypothetical protein